MGVDRAWSFRTELAKVGAAAAPMCLRWVLRCSIVRLAKLGLGLHLVAARIQPACPTASTAAHVPSTLRACRPMLRATHTGHRGGGAARLGGGRSGAGGGGPVGGVRGAAAAQQQDEGGRGSALPGCARGVRGVTVDWINRHRTSIQSTVDLVITAKPSPLYFPASDRVSAHAAQAPVPGLGGCLHRR